MSRYRVLGLDVGYSRKERSSGVLLAEVRDRVLFPLQGPFNLMQDRAQRVAAELCTKGSVRAIAVDAPLARTHQVNYRPVEAAFSRKEFQKHCKPGNTASPVGQLLHAAGMEMLDALKDVAAYANFANLESPPATPILEVFPNAALGVLISASDVLPKLIDRAEPDKSDAFFAVIRKKYEGRIGCIALDSSLFVENHDQRMAVTCAALAACFAEHEFTAVGEDASGYFLMPHLHRWKTEWRDTLALTRQSIPTAVVLSRPALAD